MGEASARWQRGLDVAQSILVIGGMALYVQVDGVTDWRAFVAFTAALGAITLWLRYARPHLGRQALLMPVLALFVMVAPFAVAGAWHELIFVAGLLMPVTLAAAAVYFSRRGRTPRRL